jgi:hypothetical protein
MRGRGRRRALALLVVLPSLVVPAAGAGQWTLRDADDWGLELGGYVRTLTAVQDPALVLPGQDDVSAFHGQVIRARWTARDTDGGRWVLEVHNRIQGQVSSEATEAGSVAGFGVSVVPDRSLDLESTWVERRRLRVWHDVDRLALTVYTGAVDVTVGRQAITWGLSALFPVADLWSRFSPFELDTEEKPGIDAVRALAYPGDGVEVDGVLADRGSWDDLSVGLRASWSLEGADVWAGAGKLWDQGMVMGGAVLLLEETRLRAEAVLPFDSHGVDRPRVTAGGDWIRGTWTVAGEVHYNGIGSDEPGGYADVLGDRRLARGESYFLGRWLAGAALSHQATDRLGLSVSALTNLADPSASFTPSVTYDVGQSARVSLGGLLSLGEAPAAGSGGVPELASEFGSYPSLGWTRLSVYF